MSQFGWAIVGPGRIANRFADALRQLPDARLVAVQSRDASRALAFASRWSDGFPAAGHADLDALLSDPDVQGVYIATPHAFHAETVRRCLLAGKPVLCEKSLTPNAALSAELAELSRRTGVFLMEGVWTRFLPVYEDVHDWLSTQSIGAIRAIQSSFAFNVPFDPQSRLFDPAQAGGALLDIGVYNLSMSQWTLRASLGACPALDSLDVVGVRGPSGVDHRVSAMLHFAGGTVAQMHCSLDGRADNSLRIFGEDGVICVPADFWQATRASLQRGAAPLQVVHRPFRINGFEGQIEEAMACIARGDIQSAVMPHADTLAVAAWSDQMRTRLGVSYPFG